MAAMLRESVVVVVVVVIVVVVVAVVRTRPRVIPLAMITMRKSTHGFPFLSYMSMGLRLATLRVAGAPLKNTVLPIDKFPSLTCTIQECDNVSTPYHPISALLTVKWSLTKGEKQKKISNF